MERDSYLKPGIKVKNVWLEPLMQGSADGPGPATGDDLPTVGDDNGASSVGNIHDVWED